MKRVLKIYNIVESVNDTGAPSQAKYGLIVRISEMENDYAYVYYMDRGNNANYESSIWSSVIEPVSDDDLHMIYLVCEEHYDRLFSGSMFMLDYETEEVIPITFTKVLES